MNTYTRLIVFLVSSLFVQAANCEELKENDGQKGIGYIEQEVIKNVAPPYPPKAAANKISGEVLVEVQISSSGNIVKARAIRGPRALVDTSVKSSYQWRFSEKAKGTKNRVKILSFFFCLSEKKTLCQAGSRFVAPSQVIILWEAYPHAND